MSEIRIYGLGKVHGVRVLEFKVLGFRTSGLESTPGPAKVLSNISVMQKSWGVWVRF